MNVFKGLTVLFCFLIILCISIRADTLYVGSAQQYKTPNDAARVAKDGDVVIIDKETYTDQAATWNASNLVIKCELPYAHLKAPATIDNKKAIWVITGDNVLVENIEFSEASVPDHNGAGIRAEGSGLTIRGCCFHDNEDGILGGGGEILIENSIFANNGFGDGLSHNLYISGNCTRLTFRYNYSHHAKIGHNLKSRAQENFILYNRIMDEADGTSSYLINLPNGGTSYIIGNLIQQGPRNDNSTLVSYGEEGLENPGKDCYIVNNTFVNDHSKGIFINIASGADSAQLINNLFVGPGNVLNGPGKQITCLQGDTTDLKDAANFDYRLRYGSGAIDAGSNPGTANGYDLTPRYHYIHPASSEEREQMDVIDIGAYEDMSNVSLCGILKERKSGISVIPLHTGLLVSVHDDFPGDFTISLFTINGRNISTVMRKVDTKKSFTIPYNRLSFSSGVYFWKIASENIHQTGTFTIMERD